MRYILLALLLVAAAGSATANDVWIRETGVHYGTIQAAINAAVAGQTVQVAAGTYPEAITIGKAITVQGAGRDTTVIDATGAAADIAVHIWMPGGSVNFDGFTVKAKGVAYPHWTFAMDAYCPTPSATITVTNSKLEGTGDPNNAEYGMYIRASTCTFVFQNNIVTKMGSNPILIERNPGATDVSYNTLDAGSWGNCCFYMTYSGINVTTLQRFSNNTFDLGTGAAYDYDHRVSALVFNSAYFTGSDTGSFSNIEIKNNRIFNAHAYSCGIDFYNDSGGDGSGGLFSNVVIDGNIIECVERVDGFGRGIGIAGRVENMTITNNTITGWNDGLRGRVGDFGTHYPQVSSVSMNNFVGNGKATAINWPSAAAELPAENNWWGKVNGPGPVGPGSGDTVSANVDYDPWLGKPANDNVLYLVPTDESIYIRPGESILVDMNVANLQQKVNACQAMLGYSSAYFADPAGGCVEVPGSGPWDQVIWDSWKDSTGIPGEIDTAIGVNANGAVGTDADGTVCKITLASKTGVEGVTQMVFRQDVPGNDTKQTFLSDMSANPVWPAKVNSTNIIIDGTAPQITCPANYSTSEATQSISASAADPVSGGVSSGVASFTMNGSPFTDPTTVVLVPGVNTFEFRAEDKAGNVATKTLTITYNQPAPTITIVKSVAPNAFGAASYPGWQANSRYAVVNGLTSYGSGFEKFEAVTTDQDYTVDMVTTFNSWLGILGSPGEYGNRLTYVYRIDNGVQSNPGAAKLNLNNVVVEMRNFWTGADNTPGDDYTDIWGYEWATRTDPAEFGAGNARLKGYNWVGGTWVEVVGGRLADMIIFDNAPGYANDSQYDPATQETLNDLYKQLSGAVINRQYETTPTKRQTLTKDEFEVKYVGHAGVGETDVTEITNYKSADATKPVITINSPADGLKTNAASQTITGTVTDTETLASGVREVKVFLNGSQVGSSYTTTDPVNFSEAVTLAEGSNTIRVDAKDFAGNPDSKTITVFLDTSAPTINIDSAVQGGAELLISKGSTTKAVQGDVTITVSASDASPSSGLLPPPVVKVKDANNVETTLTPSGSGPWTYTYTVGSGTANGIAAITASIADEAGNVSTDTDTFDVDKNQITGTVSFSTLSSVGYSFDRDVVFVATDAGGSVLKTWTIPVSFTNAAQVASGTYKLTLVPGATANLSAKTAWSLRTRQACVLDGDGQAVSSFTLLGGDLNNTNSVNVLDYSILKVNWLPINGSAADINGDGAVNTYDYSIMKGNWFKSGDAQ